MNRFLSTLLFALPLAGCGGGSGSASSLDMAMAVQSPPLSVTVMGMAQPADFSCLGSRKDPPGPMMDTVVTGKITDFQDDNIVVGATVYIWKDAADVPDPMKAIATTKAPSDKDGMYSITIPAGAPYRIIRGNSGGMAISNGNPVETIPAYEFNRNFDDANPVAVKTSTREAIPGLVSIIPDETKGVLAGAVRDCKNSETGDARVAVSMTTMTYDSDANTFYFTDQDLPTRVLHWTNPKNGTFVSLNVPPGLATVAATGVVGSGAAKTLGSYTIPVQPGAVTIVEILPAAM